jgi:hypothetical protein
MGFDPIPPTVIEDYLHEVATTGMTMSVILTDGTMLTGRLGESRYPLILYAVEGIRTYYVVLPEDRIAGILEQNPWGSQASEPFLLVHPAEQAGLDVGVGIQQHLDYLEPSGTWRQGAVIWYERDAWLYLDSNAISTRSGGINNIGFGGAHCQWIHRVGEQACQEGQRFSQAPSRRDWLPLRRAAGRHDRDRICRVLGRFER